MNTLPALDKFVLNNKTLPPSAPEDLSALSDAELFARLYANLDAIAENLTHLPFVDMEAGRDAVLPVHAGVAAEGEAA